MAAAIMTTASRLRDACFLVVRNVLLILLVVLVSCVAGDRPSTAAAAAFVLSSSSSSSWGRRQHSVISSRITAAPRQQPPPRHERKAWQPLQMCICVNCARVTNCAAYHFVESKHEQPHMTESPTFMPRDGSPTIHVNIRSVRSQEEREKERQRMWNEYKAEEQRAMEAAAAAKANAAEDQATELHGETVYDLSPQIIYEYDVVECADYVDDPGCWVRNMPEEIKRANPQFVPT